MTINYNIDKPSCSECPVNCNTFFRILSKEDLLDLSIDKTSRLYKKNKYIYNEGSNPVGVYCLHQGKVKITKDSYDGREHILRFINPGEMFGINALISGEKHASAAIAIEDSVVCLINSRKMLDLILNYPNMINYILIYLNKMLEDAECRMASLSMKSTRERVAEALLVIHNSFLVEAKRLIPIKLSREDLANFVGSATESVIRILSEFKEEQIIEIYGRDIYIRNLIALEKIAHSPH